MKVPNHVIGVYFDLKNNQLCTISNLSFTGKLYVLCYGNKKITKRIVTSNVCFKDFYYIGRL